MITTVPWVGWVTAVDGLRAAVGVGVVGQHVDGRGRGVLGDGLGVVDRDRRSSTSVTVIDERLLDEQPRGVGGSDPDQRAGVVLVVEDGGRPQRRATDREGAVVGPAGPGHEGEGVGVAGVGVDRAQRADHRPGRLVLWDGRRSQREVGGRLVRGDLALEEVVGARAAVALVAGGAADEDVVASTPGSLSA